MAQTCEVVPYSIHELKRLLGEAARARPQTIEDKYHIDYFQSYFSRLDTEEGISAPTTIVAEKHYTDRAFLEDFSAYQVRCFRPYRRKCCRLHFFDLRFSLEDFEALVLGKGGRLTEQELREGYLGFMVLKPLPETMIGRTCLKTYPKKGRRSFSTTRPYEVNLFGISLYIDSLAFQEQDGTASTCATCALWSMFHGTGKLFQHPIPPPVEITKAANSHWPMAGRTLPSEGLTIEQMADAIRSVHLEPFPIATHDDYVVKGNLYAYLAAHLPLVMSVFLVNVSTQPDTFIGSHAIAITGCSLGERGAVPHGETSFLLRASRIEKVYAHDDQVGPFACMVLDGHKVSFSFLGETITAGSMLTSWRDVSGSVGNVRAVPDGILAALYHKIRIPFATVEDSVIHFDDPVEALRSSGKLALPQRLEWDIGLTTANELKGQIREAKSLPDRYRRDILFEEMPRFIWRAVARCADKALLELLFDATDMQQGSFFSRAIEYDLEDEPSLSLVLREVSKEQALQQALASTPAWMVFEWFAKQPM